MDLSGEIVVCLCIPIMFMYINIFVEYKMIEYFQVNFLCFFRVTSVSFRYFFLPPPLSWPRDCLLFLAFELLE